MLDEIVQLKADVTNPNLLNMKNRKKNLEFYFYFSKIWFLQPYFGASPQAGSRVPGPGLEFLYNLIFGTHIPGPVNLWDTYWVRGLGPRTQDPACGLAPLFHQTISFSIKLLFLVSDKSAFFEEQIPYMFRKVMYH